MRIRVILALLLAFVLPLVLAAGEGVPRLSIFPPSHLSATETTEILVALAGTPGASGELVATVASRDEKVSAEVSRTPASPGPTLSLSKVPIPAAALAAFRLGEELNLSVRFVSSGGPTLEGTVPATLLAEGARAESGSWNLVLADKPAQVYTTRTTLLKYIIFNPKNNPKSANIVLKFKGDEDKVKAKWKFGMSIPAGISEQVLYVPSSVTSQARLKGATLLQSALMRDGASKAKDQALVDFDLNATAAADPASGSAPLRVSFTANATGGTPPYVYNWTFGDGSAASEQNPYHNFPEAGIYIATLTVTDTLGAKVTDDLTVTVEP